MPLERPGLGVAELHKRVERLRQRWAVVIIPNTMLDSRKPIGGTGHSSR